MLGTQFEATDARRIFPCWDEPGFRARFQLTAVIPENWMAVSNMPIEQEKKVAGGKEVRFGMTPSMARISMFCRGRAGRDRDEERRRAPSRHGDKRQSGDGPLRTGELRADLRIL